MIKVTLLYGHPKSADDFEKYYAEKHGPIAQKIKGVRRIELSKALSTPSGGTPPYYRMAELYFDNAEHMHSVLGSPEGKAALADLPNFATGGVTTLVSELE